MIACTTYRRIVSGEAGGMGPSLARGVLGALSVPYAWGASLAEILAAGREAVDVGLPVLSVGNITAGGTGKTPVTALVVAELKKRGRRPVILSRGYRSDASGRNDEALVLARLHPDVIHLQGRDRAALARHVADARLGDAIVLDDGYQYQRLARRLNVCCIDATNPFGHGRPLPRGLLREPLAGLYRARPVMITRAELSTPQAVAAIRAEVLRHNPHAKFVVSEMRPVAVRAVRGEVAADPAALRDRQVLLASGIGNPASFARNVRMLGARVREHSAAGDHHAWTQAEAADLARRAREVGAGLVLTTAKDAVKLGALPWPADAVPLACLDVEAVVTDGAGVWASLLDEALGGA